jgi:hypothetical protein
MRETHRIYGEVISSCSRLKVLKIDIVIEDHSSNICSTLVLCGIFQGIDRLKMFFV